jgi:hypothetical protein
MKVVKTLNSPSYKMYDVVLDNKVHKMVQRKCHDGWQTEVNKRVVTDNGKSSLKMNEGYDLAIREIKKTLDQL